MSISCVAATWTTPQKSELGHIWDSSQSTKLPDLVSEWFRNVGQISMWLEGLVTLRQKSRKMGAMNQYEVQLEERTLTEVSSLFFPHSLFFSLSVLFSQMHTNKLLQDKLCSGPARLFRWSTWKSVSWLEVNSTHFSYYILKMKGTHSGAQTWIHFSNWFNPVETLHQMRFNIQSLHSNPFGLHEIFVSWLKVWRNTSLHIFLGICLLLFLCLFFHLEFSPLVISWWELSCE